MKKRIIVWFILIVLITGPTALSGADKDKDSWHTWLDEVEPILTRMERSVARLLNTEEERTRFQDMFWKARDPLPDTRLNEYKQDYYRRLRYADQYLGGVKTDRGRIYVLLGPPHNKSTFSGYRDLVEAELWNYQHEDRPGLLPFMNLIFFRPRNMGDFQLYHPGIHSPKDLLSPQVVHSVRSKFQAFREVKMNNSELASASLSIVPGEGDPRTGMSLTSSNFALSRVYSLPEREAELGYIRGFKSPAGTVEVTHSTRAIRGFGYAAVVRNKGMNFVHYALMPDQLTMVQTSKDVYSADVQLHINIETGSGTIIFQRRRDIPFKGDKVRAAAVLKRKVVCRDFVPIIEGEYTIALTFINDTTKEFFSYTQKVHVTDAADGSGVQAVAGYQIKEINTNNSNNTNHTNYFMPFAIGPYLVLTDPRGHFSQKDTVQGVVLANGQPLVQLEKAGDEEVKITLPTKMHVPGIHRFLKTLNEIKDGTYQLTVNGHVMRTIHILPFYIEITRPLVIEHPENAAAWNNYLFVRAQQYMAVGETEKALADFNAIPRSLWWGTVVPVIARSYYSKGDYERVMELLEPAQVKKEYPVLMMLANSAIELKRFPKALQYLQKIREYGETVEINHLVAATYLSMGDREKARLYYDRAKKLAKQKEVK